MFKLACRVDDKNLAKVLRLLHDLTHDVEVRADRRSRADDSAKIAIKPKINGKRPTYDTSKEMVAAELRKLGGIINAEKMREVLTAIGFSPTSYSYFFNELVKNKMLKRHGKGTATTYEWPG